MPNDGEPGLDGRMKKTEENSRGLKLREEKTLEVSWKDVPGGQNLPATQREMFGLKPTSAKISQLNVSHTDQ